MTRRKFRTKLEIPDNLPASVEELQAMVVELRAYMDKKRSQKAQSMARWRDRKRQQTRQVKQAVEASDQQTQQGGSGTIIVEEFY